MATNNFDAAQAVVPVKPDRLQLTFDVVQVGANRQYSGAFDFRIQTSDNREVERRQGDLAPHLTAQQQTALVAFLDAMMDKARSTVP